MSLIGLDITNKRSKIVFISLVYKKFSVSFEDTGIDAKLKISLKIDENHDFETGIDSF